MHSIPPPDIDSEDVFDDITTAKRQPTRRRLEAARRRVVAAYGMYENAAPSVESLVPATVTNVQRKALHHAYSVETAPMLDLREKLNEPVMAARCPFCGVSESGTLDHYLPKELYPEFSIFALNLVPSCAKCNTRKRTLIVDEDTDVRLFLHPYFDDIPNQPFLTVRVGLRQGALLLEFRVRQPAGMSQARYFQLRSHFKQLDLADRYRKLSLVELRGRHGGFVRFYQNGGGAARVAAELQAEADDYEAAHGSNFWRVILYRALAAHDGFCDGGFDVVKPPQADGAEQE